MDLSYSSTDIFPPPPAGLTVNVDASSTTDPNPISSYTWDWGENITLPTSKFDTANDVHIVTLHPSIGNVLQCAVKNPDTGNIYATQARNGTNGTASPYQTTQLSRMDSTGALIDYIELLDAGHGTSFALEYTGGKTYVWLSWQAPASGGSSWDLVRFPYPVGGGTYSRTSPPPGMTVPYPGGASGLGGGTKVDVQFDVQKDRVVIRTTGPSGHNTFRQAVLSNFLVGGLTVYNTVVLPVGPPSLQGFFTYDYSLFVYWGAGYTQVATTDPTIDTADPPVLKEYRWYDGVEIASYDPSWWAKPYLDGHYEPESATLYYPSGGSPSAWVGWITGTTNSYKYDLLQVPLLPDSESVPVKTSSGKTASHAYQAAGNYNITLTVKDSAGLVDSATNTVAVGVTTVNQPPTASFVTAATNTTVSFDASGSHDSDGSIAGYAWAFGDGASGTGVTTSHTYAASGTYTATLTVTDNLGAKASASKSITVSTAPVPVTSTTGGDSGGSGVQPTGTGILLYQNLSGTDFSKVVNAAGLSNMCSLQAKGYSFSNFAYGNQTIAYGNSAYGAYINNAKGIIGAGSKYTTIEMLPYTSNKAGDVPPGPATGSATAPTNQLEYVLIYQISNFKLDGVKIIGTNQGHLYNGVFFHTCASPTISNITVTGIPGNDSGPPGETFMLNVYKGSGTVTVKNVTLDGQGVAAVGFGSNNTTQTFNVTNLLCKNTGYSAGWATWEQNGIVNTHNFVTVNCIRSYNAERHGGVSNHYDPVWCQPASGHYDINYTWETGYTNGQINFYFSSAQAWQNYIAARTTKQITIVTNPHSLGDIRSTVRIFVGGVQQPTLNYVDFYGYAT